MCRWSGYGRGPRCKGRRCCQSRWRGRGSPPGCGTADTTPSTFLAVGRTRRASSPSRTQAPRPPKTAIAARLRGFRARPPQGRGPRGRAGSPRARTAGRGAARRELHRCRRGIRVAVLSGGGAVGTGDGGAHSTVRVFEVVVCCTMVATATSTASTVSPASSWSSSVTLLRTAAVTSGIDRGLIICRVPRR